MERWWSVPYEQNLLRLTALLEDEESLIATIIQFIFQRLQYNVSENNHLEGKTPRCWESGLSGNSYFVKDIAYHVMKICCIKFRWWRKLSFISLWDTIFHCIIYYNILHQTRDSLATLIWHFIWVWLSSYMFDAVYYIWCGSNLDQTWDVNSTHIVIYVNGWMNLSKLIFLLCASCSRLNVWKDWPINNAYSQAKHSIHTRWQIHFSLECK